MERNAAQVQQFQDIGIGQFTLQCDAQHIKITDWPFTFQSKEGRALTPHQLERIQPRQIGPVRHDMGQVVQNRVQDLESQVRNTHFIDIWKCEAKPHLCGLKVLVAGIQLMVNVARRLADLVQKQVGWCFICDNLTFLLLDFLFGDVDHGVGFRLFVILFQESAKLAVKLIDKDIRLRFGFHHLAEKVCQRLFRFSAVAFMRRFGVIGVVFIADEFAGRKDILLLKVIPVRVLTQLVLQGFILLQILLKTHRIVQCLGIG